MPARDGTGPEGRGSKTGRGLGPCSGTAQTPDQGAQGASTSWLGRLFRRRRGSGQGRSQRGSGSRGQNR